MLKRINFRFQKKYFAFFAIVPLLTVSAIIRMPCPVCGGTGEISSTGMGLVSILKTDSTLLSVGDFQGCLDYRTYTYNVVMVLQNAGPVDATGYVRVGLIDYTTSRILSTQYSQVYVPANTVASTAFKSIFAVSLTSPTTTKVAAQTMLNNVPCEACSGTGMVALNYWPFAQILAKKIIESQLATTTPYVPPPVQFFVGEPPEGHD